MGQSIRFVVLGTQRTGTTLIRTSLNSHPNVLCGGEVFLLGKAPYKKDDGYWSFVNRTLRNRVRAAIRPRAMCEEYIDQLFSHPGYSAIGFKFMLKQHLSRPYVLPMLHKRGVKPILVRRWNCLKTLVSRRTAEQSGVFHVSRDLKVGTAVDAWTPKKIDLDTSRLISDLDAIDAEPARWREILGPSCDYLEVVYEDYCQNAVEENNRVLDYLGVKRARLYSDLAKVNPDQLSQIIGNYEDVRNRLENSKYSSFLD